MIIYENGEEWYLDPERLAAELSADNKTLVCISQTGELVFDDEDKGEFYAREVWQARPNGYPNAYRVAGMDFEFVRSVNMETEIYP